MAEGVKQAVILAAGEGTRLRPLTYRRPKVLIPIANEAFLGHQLNLLRSVGIEKVTPVDTTGAGDLYAAGFLYGYCNGQSLEICGKMGSILGGHITEVIGAKMDDQKWSLVKGKVEEIYRN